MTAVNRPITTGVQSFVLWGKETTYKAVTTPTKHFGLETNFEPSLNNNMKSNRGFKGSASGGRKALKFTSGKAESTYNIEFEINDDEFLELVMGDKTGSVYTESDFPPSFTLVNAMSNLAINRNEVYTGCVVNSATIRGAEGEPVTCNMSIANAGKSFSSTLATNTALTDKAPYTFSESIFELPAATSINNIINDFEITIENNWTLHYGNSREATAATPGAHSLRCRLSTKYVDDGLLNKALGGSSIASDTPTQNASFKIVLTRPDDDTLTFDFALSPIDTYNLRGALNEAVEESVEIVSSSLTITKA